MMIDKYATERQCLWPEMWSYFSVFLMTEAILHATQQIIGVVSLSVALNIYNWLWLSS